MPSRILTVTESAQDKVRQQIQALQNELGVDAQFTAAVLGEVESGITAPKLPKLDLTSLPFITIDPPTSKDLDQAMYLEKNDSGYFIRYAIADLMAFITPAGELAAETLRRGVTLYGADEKIPLHPTILSEGAASLLPNQVCPAFVWEIKLDNSGEIVQRGVRRALVKSTYKGDYQTAQQQVESGELNTQLGLLAEIGKLRQAIEIARGGVSLPMPEQQLDISGEQWSLEFRQMSEVENWNAQISLLTGISAAEIMLDGGVGILRTLPPPEDFAVKRLRRTALGLQISWPDSVNYPDFVRSLDPNNPKQAAMILACTSLMRGAGYAVFQDGMLPEQPQHAAIAANYAHVTAPLRRLVDRFALEICAALTAGEPIPTWVTETMPKLPEIMRDADRKAHTYENAIINLVEANLLQPMVGQTFQGIVLERDGGNPERGQIQIADPAIEAEVSGNTPLPVGELIKVKLTLADPKRRLVRFQQV